MRAWWIGLLSVSLAAAEEALPLRPGRLVGEVQVHRVRKGERVDQLAVTYGVHPVRVTALNRKALADGLQAGETLRIDQRRIEPHFQPEVTGLVLNVPEAHLYWVTRGRLLRDFPVGVTRPSWPLPLGVTRVVAKVRDPAWKVPVSIQREMARQGKPVLRVVPPGPRNPLGTRWIGFANGSFGFHGTNAPSSIKRYASHGCVRMLNSHVEELYERVQVGTPVRIAYQPVQLAVDGTAVWMAVYPDIYGLYPDLRVPAEALAREAGVWDRVDWRQVRKKINEQNGLVSNVSMVPNLASPPAVPGL